MEETLLDDAKTPGAPPGGKPVDEEGSNGAPEGGNQHGAPDVEALRRLKLTGFLRELVRVEGRMEAAKLLGVNYRTLVRAEEKGDMTGRISDALERLLWKADGAEMVRLRDRVGALEERVETLAGDLESNTVEVRAHGAGEDESLPSTGQDSPHVSRPDPSPARGPRPGPVTAPPVLGLRSEKPSQVRSRDPEVVTEVPGDDDPGVYGPAWPLVEEWRRLRAGHPNRGGTMSWLVTEERLLVLELALLEEFGLTLPPETEPLRGFGRRGQTGWRWKALDDTRRALRKRRRLRWVRRVLTCGLWWR